MSSFYDPLLAKLLVSSSTRAHAISNLRCLLDSENYFVGASLGKVTIDGPPNNIEFVAQVLAEDVFVTGRATTEWVDHGGVSFIPQ